MNTKQISRRTFLSWSTTLAAGMAVNGCSSSATPPSTPLTATPAPMAVAIETAPDGATPPPGYEGKSWADIVAEAKGQTVNFNMWGGSESANNWVSKIAATQLKEKYDVTLNMVPLEDASEAVNTILAEKQAGKNSDGTIDLIWINGDNFRNIRQAEALFGPWSQYLPNTRYVDWSDPGVSNDKGFKVDNYESPYAKAQFVMIYDSAKVPTPPKTIDGLLAWVKENPGKFTYPALPDFTGTAFVMHICYHTSGGYEQFLREFDQALFDEKLATCWQTLNEIEPYLWNKGQTYPETLVRQEELFAKGEVYFSMAYNPAKAARLVEAGTFPETTRTFVFESGTLANTSYVAIPYNTPRKAGAMVLANLLLSPEMQVSKADIANWGEPPAVNVALLPQAWKAKFASLPRGKATLPDEILALKRLPELSADWQSAVKKAWEANVLKQ